MPVPSNSAQQCTHFLHLRRTNRDFRRSGYRTRYTPSAALRTLYTISDSSIRLSIRSWPPNSMTHFLNTQTKTIGRKMLSLALVGTSVAITGFVCQTIGKRALHWSAGLCQLDATLFLAALRAWLRRHVGDKPPLELELAKRVETCDLACYLESLRCGSLLQS